MYFSHIYNLFQIRPPIQPLNKIDVGKIQLNFGVFTVKYIYYNRSGNDLQTINLIGAMASTFERVPYVSTLKCGTSTSCVLNSFCLLHKVILFLYFFSLFCSIFVIFFFISDTDWWINDRRRCDERNWSSPRRQFFKWTHLYCIQGSTSLSSTLWALA